MIFSLLLVIMFITVPLTISDGINNSIISLDIEELPVSESAVHQHRQHRGHNNIRKSHLRNILNMVQHKAQDVGAKQRTEDIKITEDIDFKTMLLPKTIVQGLKKSGYIKPSPIQRKAVPLVRCGLDLIVQAKAGTGKTCVFTIAALEMVQPTLPRLQAVILAPTREIALQITEVIMAIGRDVTGLKTCCFIGGYPVSLDISNAAGCHIAVGAPGRMKHLVEKGILKTEHVRLFVLDEADKLMEPAFVDDINFIFSHLPESKQVLACSATYTTVLIEFLSCYMHRGQYVTPEPASGVNTTVLVGIRQFVSVMALHVDKLAQLQNKEKHLLHLLRSVSFNQCLIFSNLHSRATSLCNVLRGKGWSAEWIAGRQGQDDRVLALSHLKEQKVRVLVTTDLTARGIDVENVNLIINLDVPVDHNTYLHRMGRAGRYGSHGMVISVVSSEEELATFQRHLGAIGGTSQSVSKIPDDLRNIDLWTISEDNLEKVNGIVESKNRRSRKKSVHKYYIDSGQKVNGKPLAEVSREINQSETSTDTDEKYSQESASSSDDCDENVSSICDITLVSKEGAKQSEYSTDTDEKFSQESSSDSAVIFKCKGNVPANSDCSCNLFKAQPADITVEVGSSIFCATESEEHWNSHLPVVVHESKLPLGLPLILLDSKFLRLKSAQELDAISVYVDSSEGHTVSFETNCETKKFLSFEEIGSLLSSEVIDLSSNKNTMCYPGRIKHGEILSFNEIEDILNSSDPETKLCPDKKDEIYDRISQVLTKYEKSRKTLELYFKRFNCFDVIGWMALDEKFNILEKLKSGFNEIFTFTQVKCHSGINHIEILSSKVSTKAIEIKNNDADHVFAYNLNALNLIPPFSIVNIVEQLMPNKNITNGCDHLDISKKENTTETYNKKQKKTSTDSISKKSVNINEHKIKSKSLSQPLKKSNHSKKAQIDSHTKASPAVSNTAQNLKQRNVEAHSKQNRPRIKVTKAQVKQQKSANSYTNSISALGAIGESNILTCSTLEKKLIQSHKRQDTVEMKSKVTLKSRKETQLSSSKPNQSRNSFDAQNGRPHTSSTGSEDSGSYIDIPSLSPERWNELKDFDKRITDSSDESCVLQLSKPKPPDITSDSSDVPYETSQGIKQKSFNDRVAKQMKKQRERQLQITKKAVFDDSDSLGSEASTHNCFETASEHRDSGKDLEKKKCFKIEHSNTSNLHTNTLCQSKSSKNGYGHSEKKQDKNSTHPHSSKKAMHNRFGTENIHGRNTQHRDNTHQNEQYQELYYQNQTSSDNVRTLRADNLASEWYYTWYARVRQRAQQLEMIEYINTMSSL